MYKARGRRMATSPAQHIETAATVATTAEAAVGARKTRLEPQVSSFFQFFFCLTNFFYIYN
jgi:hypothetical protein